MRGMVWIMTAGLAALVAGCASTAPQSQQMAAGYGARTGTSTDRLFRNDGVEATREHPRHAYEPSDARLLADYGGIEGARAAHLDYANDRAESLDGACESSVRTAEGETLYDIAELCDVSLTALMSANPQIGNPRHVAPGQMLRVPGMPDSERQAIVVAYLSGVAPAHAGQAGIPTTLYVSQPGDSLERISAVHLVSEARVATLNPGVDWERLKPGVEIRLPAQGVVVAAPGAHAGAAKKATSRADVVTDESASGQVRDRDLSDDLTKVMPFRLRPARGSVDPGVDDSSNVLGVDRTFVKPGSDVTVSATGLPANARVTISRGGNRNNLKEVDSATTGPDGSLNARVRVPEGADAGGVIFKATVDKNGRTIYSDRVGVETVKK